MQVTDCGVDCHVCGASVGGWKKEFHDTVPTSHLDRCVHPWEGVGDRSVAIPTNVADAELMTLNTDAPNWREPSDIKKEGRAQVYM